MNNLVCSLIKIAGYRGRYFVLKMNPRGQHTVFIMDGNTGKTTAIELLRWCFRYPESNAVNKYEHMWFKPAHVLDDTKKGRQTCEITIQFSAIDDKNHEHFFQLRRVTKGEYINNYPPVGDKIESITDSLEIDRGKQVLVHDEVYDYLAREFRFNISAQHCFFDGEKAREMMQLTSDSEKIETLLNLVNQRTTHPVLEEYKRRLNLLRERVLSEAKARLTDKALEISMGRLRNKIEESQRAEKSLAHIERQIDSFSLAQKRCRDDMRALDQQVREASAASLRERTRYEIRQGEINREVTEKRQQIYEDCLGWNFSDIVADINLIKAQVKERGRLPEPYRQDLIRNCLANDVCEICGRRLDDTSRERVKRLERQVAPHEVHVFLSSSFSMPLTSFDPKARYDAIKALIDERKKLDTKIKSITLSEKDKGLVSQRDTLDVEYEEHGRRIGSLTNDRDTLKQAVGQIKKEIVDLQDKNAALSENKVILDQIERSMQAVDSAAESIKLKATDIISSVISEGVSSILGRNFGARLSLSDGLMLGEDGFYGKEKGGYSGRLVLSYCFAEAMTLVEPIIVDTPVGNIGSQREKLAAHLVANHNQVILLCLPTETANFAPLISKKPIVIENLQR